MESLALDWLITQSTLELPNPAFRRLVHTVADPRQLLALDPARRKELLLSSPRLRELKDNLSSGSLRDRWQEMLANAGAGVISLGCDDYPALLKEIHDAPVLLFYRGDLRLLQRPMVAVVGSRRPSRSGVSDAQAFANALSESGITVVSGMALGIDGAAHRGALSGPGSSIGVLGTGLDVCYPRRNQDLYTQLGERGLLLSEFPLGAGPRRHQFPLRNRVISGMSLGVLVIEAAINSGSLITARQALEQNREVFALPGSIHNPASRGCNALIRQGAKLVETLADILEEFEGWSARVPEPGPTPAALPAPGEDTVFLELGFEPTPLDVLVQRAKLPAGKILGMLTELEMAGWVERQAGGWQRCR